MSCVLDVLYIEQPILGPFYKMEINLDTLQKLLYHAAFSITILFTFKKYIRSIYKARSFFTSIITPFSKIGNS